MSRPVYLTITARLDDDQLASRTVESMMRIASGLALEGVTVTVTMGPEELEEDEGAA